MKTAPIQLKEQWYRVLQNFCWIQTWTHNKHFRNKHKCSQLKSPRSNLMGNSDGVRWSPLFKRCLPGRSINENSRLAGKEQAFPSRLHTAYLGSLWEQWNWASKDSKWLKHILLESAQYQLSIQDASPGFLLSCPSVMCQFPSLLYSWPPCLFFCLLSY